MNSDPHDSAAWRAFGMLDADESAGFDEAMRHDGALQAAYGEMTRISAAVAASAAPPVPVRAGQLERLHLRLGLGEARRTNWPAISGWAAAIALGVVLSLQGTTVRPPAPVAEIPQAPTAVAAAVADFPEVEESVELAETAPALLPAAPAPEPAFVAIPEMPEIRTVAGFEAKRLIQQIEVLRDQLESFEKRDQQRMQPVEGMAWPIVMRMSPPEILIGPAHGAALMRGDPPLTAVLGDALVAAGTESPPAAARADATEVGATDPSAVTTSPDGMTPAPEPSATPIYDAARDTGTLVVNHLPLAAEGEVYNLWVTTEKSPVPVYLGRLPKSAGSAADSFDFNLGGAAVIPTGFMLTRDPSERPQPPHPGNLVLVGPK